MRISQRQSDKFRGDPPSGRRNRAVNTEEDIVDMFSFLYADYLQNQNKKQQKPGQPPEEIAAAKQTEFSLPERGWEADGIFSAGKGLGGRMRNWNKKGERYGRGFQSD